jgi:hypothetical protein
VLNLSLLCDICEVLVYSVMDAAVFCIGDLGWKKGGLGWARE